MTQLVISDPQKQCDALTAKGSALLAADHHYLDPEMADFISRYLRALSYDVDEAIGSESRERKALLPLIPYAQRALRACRGHATPYRARSGHFPHG